MNRRWTGLILLVLGLMTAALVIGKGQHRPISGTQQAAESDEGSSTGLAVDPEPVGDHRNPVDSEESEPQVPEHPLDPGGVRILFTRPANHPVLPLECILQPSRQLRQGGEATRRGTHPDTVTFSDVAPGLWYVATQFASCSIHVEANQVHEHTFEVPLSWDIRGVVVDKDGTPVAGARVVGSMHESYTENQVLDTTVDGGTFEARVYSDRVLIHATAPGHRASARVAVRRLANRKLWLELGESLRLRGRIVNSEGAPITTATVYCGTRSPLRLMGPEGVLNRYSAPPIVSSVGESGEFVVGSAPRIASEQLTILAPGYCPITFAYGDRYRNRLVREAIVRDGMAPEWDLGTIELESGVELTGEVVDSAGNGLIRARVSRGPPGSFQYFEVLVDSSGRFRIPGCSSTKPTLLRFRCPGYQHVVRQCTNGESIRVVLKPRE